VFFAVLVRGVRKEPRRSGRYARPGYYGLEGVGYVAVAYADPCHDAEETHQTDDTGAVGRKCQSD